MQYKDAWKKDAVEYHSALKRKEILMLQKTLESPLDARRSNQSILKEISPEYSLEGLMLKLKLQYLDHLI